MVASEPGDATPQEAARLPAPTLEILEFRNNVLLELCWLHFEDFLVSLGSDRRRYSGRLCAAKRAQWDQPADEVVHTVARQLDDTRAIFLRREFGYLQAALLRPGGRNDIQWILSTGGSFGPSQQQLLQRLGPLVYRTLAGFMDSQPMARVLARIVRDRALALWYHPTLLALLPMVCPRDAGSFQRWYADFEFQQRANHAAMFCSGTLEAGRARPLNGFLIVQGPAVNLFEMIMMAHSLAGQLFCSDRAALVPSPGTQDLPLHLHGTLCLGPV
eukprot:s6395_g3.t2